MIESVASGLVGILLFPFVFLSSAIIPPQPINRIDAFHQAIQQKNVTQAESLFNQIQENPQKMTPFMVKKLKLELADFYLDQNDTDKAKPLFQSLIDSGDPQFYPKASLKNLLIRMKTKENILPISAAYVRLVLAYPTIDQNQKIWTALKSALNVTSFEDLLETAEDLDRYADILYGKRQFKEAVVVLNRLTSQYPSYAKRANAVTLLGMCYFQIYEYDKAILTFIAVKDQYRDSPDAIQSTFYLGRTYARKKQYGDSIAQYQELIKKYPQNTTYAPEAYYYLFETMLINNQEADFDSYLSRFKADFPQSLYYNKIIWEKGIQLYQSKKYAEALAILGQYSTKAPSNDLKSRFLFLMAQSSARMGDAKKAEHYQKACVTQYPYSYAAFRILDTKQPVVGAQLDSEKWTHQILNTPKNDELPILSAYAALKKEDLNDLVAEELSNQIASGNQSFDYTVTLAAVYQRLRNYYQSVQLLSKQFNLIDYGMQETVPKEVAKLVYPLVHWDIIKKYAKEYDLDPFFVIAVIRAESLYHDQIYSRTGAVGLMQIMPATGKGIASHLGVPWREGKTLLDIETNIRFGAYYLSHLSKRFNGNQYLMLSGYNAGPNITKKWEKEIGADDIDQFVISIPYAETQYYVQKVMQNYWIYKLLYSSEKDVASK